MKTKFIFFSLLIFSISNSQIISGRIISSENNQAIPFARIGVVGENIGEVSIETGHFTIDLTPIDKTKKIKVQLGGFNSYEQNIKDFINSNNHTIVMKEKVSDIAEVIINPKKV